MRSLFEKNLMRMKQELTDLKTAHRRGLGTIRFYRHRITTAINQYDYIVIKGTLAADEPGFPLVMALVRGNDTSVQPAAVMDTWSKEGYVEAEIYAGLQTSVTVDIICSSAISSLEVEP